MVDVATTRVIPMPRAVVAQYAADPTNAPSWYSNIRSAEWLTDPPVALGSRVVFSAKFLGRELRYTYEVVEYETDERLVMRTVDGPFPMETTYDWSDHQSGGTVMTLRNRGEATGFAKVAQPLMATAMRRENRKDLERLEDVLLAHT
jgi:hypothetical protein